MAIVVDAVYEERYWYPEEGGQVWLAGYQLVEPESGRYLGRDAPELAARGLRVAGVAGASRHHGEALAVEDSAKPGEPPNLVVAGGYTRTEFETLMTKGVPSGGRKLKNS